MTSLTCKGILLISIALFASGCASFYPLPINEPPAKDSAGNRTTADYQRSGLLPAKNIQEAIENLKIYGDSYQDYADKLRQNEYIFSDISLAGAVTGVAGGLTKSFQTAIAGAVIASGSSIISQRYQFLVQATNYEKASDTMYCMYTKMYQESAASLSLVDFINERINEVRRKLRKNQSTLQLINPDLAKLEAAISNNIPRKKDKAQADHLRASGTVLSAAQMIDIKDVDLEYYKSELTKCVAAF